jgi:hypothetical protein
MKMPLKIIITISYVFMILLNALANILPIAGVSTGEISDRYGNLFAPAGLTFSIWGVIYVALLVYVISVWFNVIGTDNKNVGLFFALSSLLNGLWILAWHYELLLISIVLMIGILISLIYIATNIKENETNMRIIFHIYFAWITVAMIANITTFLVSIQFSFLMSDVYWTFIVLWIGVIVFLTTGYTFKSVTYMLVGIWAYAGILIKHLTYFNQLYPLIILTLWGSLAIMGSMAVYLIYPKTKSKTNTFTHT